MQSRRDNLKEIAYVQTWHAGLWFDKYLKQQLPSGTFDSAGQQKKTPQQELVEQCAKIEESTIYQAFFERWQTALASTATVKKKTAKVQGRMAVGLGDESAIETAVTLHHTYGVPYIPGSALKGLAASFAHQRLADDTWRKGGAGHTELFGSTAITGLVTFFDALYVPGSGVNGQALYPDVITVHHQDYYQGKAAPADWDNPNPVSFLSATGSYLIALAGPPDWVNAAFEILEQALLKMGIGAKTSSGYGRLVFEAPDDSASTGGATAEAESEQPDVANFKLQLAAMPAARVAGDIEAVVNRWRELDIEDIYRQQIARAILAKVKEAGREKKSKDKAWYQALLAGLPEKAGG